MPILSNFPGGSGGGGGLALAAVSNITTLTSSGKVYIKWTDPDDLVVAESTLASWGGTLLVRKAGSMPTSRRDGTVVIDSTTRNQYSNAYFCDSGLSDGTTYYYKFFPYTTTGTYTDSEDDEFSATPTAQVAGIDSWNVTSIVASEEAGNGKMTIKWSDPAATITSDGVTLATWASTTVVVKEGSYATDKDDSDAVYTLKVTTRNQYANTPLTVTGLTNGTTYYISFFPETTDGGVNASTTQRDTGVANRITIDNVPSQSGSLTYNGGAQSPTWSNYNTTYMTIGGTTSGTNAGSYSATFTPTTDYRWSDGTTTAKTVSWSIGKATGTLTVSPNSIELSPSNLSDTFTIGGNHDGTISVVSNNTGIATVSRSGNTVTVNNVNQTTGNTTITVSCTAGTNYTAPSSQSVTVEAKFVSSVLNENDWSVIKSVADASQGANYWAVGDRKAVTVNGTVGTQAINGTYYVYILGFDHNSSREGTGITFGTFKTALSGGTDICLVDSHYNDYSTGGQKWFNMNHSSNTNSGGWKGCDLRYDVLGSTNSNNNDAGTTTATSPVSGTLMAALPSDLRAVMKPMNIYTDNTGGGSNTASYVTKSVDYLPLLAEYEIFGTRSYANSAEQNYQAQYQYYKNGNSKVKYRHSSTSSIAYWWERSPYYNLSNTFCYVYTNGYASGYNARFSIGLAPAAFRV
ncbi:DUF6273 domain-containing protein [Neglectibacter timonensis]|uniref:DUF6273 domain-containing protein n=1 Tax=Neglectibacter timonensis TaxID=1776382 RepID=UPI0032197DFD